MGALQGQRGLIRAIAADPRSLFVQSWQPRGAVPGLGSLCNARHGHSRLWVPGGVRDNAITGHEVVSGTFGP